MRHPFSIFRTQAALASICAGLLLAAFPGDQAAAATYRTLPAGTSIVGALQSTVGLVWRALLLWMMSLLLMSGAVWLG